MKLQKGADGAPVETSFASEERMTMDHFSEYKAIQNEINAALETYFTADCPQKELLDAMRYSLLAGGKRIRPLLLVKFCEISGGDRASALPAACGIEMLHTYSLIHDDLPCMDNDDLRRGKPTCHKMFGETNAVLAGDALQSAAYCAVLSAPAAPERTAAMAKTLAFAAAEQGMCGGQYLDTSKEGLPVTEAELYEIHRLKTGALLRAACVMGVQCAGGTPEQVSAAEEYAMNLWSGFPDPRRCARHNLHGGRVGQDHRFRRCREKRQRSFRFTASRSVAGSYISIRRRQKPPLPDILRIRSFSAGLPTFWRTAESEYFPDKNVNIFVKTPFALVKGVCFCYYT